jgi:glycine cleavage system aminomethyltransferase T
LSYDTLDNFFFCFGRSIAYGYLTAAQRLSGARVEITYFGREHWATVTREPLFDPQGERLRG